MTVLWAAPVHAQQENERVLEPTFEFHSGFWINLHHFLYLQARLRGATAERSAGDSRFQKSGATIAQTSDSIASSPTAITADQQKAWDAALADYAADWSSRDLLYNRNMALINDRLAEIEDCPDILGNIPVQCISGLTGKMAAALHAAAPVYRARWWPEQDRENRAWIAKVTPLVRRMGSNLGAQLSDVFDRGWPQARLRVDVVWYAGPAGAYTSLDPLHITLSSHDSRNQGMAGFSVLFREASQAVSIGVNQQIVRDYRQLAKPIPRDLWPALLLYTTGELLTREPTSARSTQNDVSAADTYRSSMADRGWNNYREVLELYWQRYLDGTLGMETAIARIAAAL